MNLSTAIFLINESVRAVEVIYSPEDANASVGSISSGKTRKALFKTLDTSIKKDDYVIVPSTTRWKMTVCKVSAENVDIDLDSSTPMDWVVAKVDKAQFESNKASEARAIEIIRDAEFADKRKKLREKLSANTLAGLKELPISDINGDSPPASP